MTVTVNEQIVGRLEEVAMKDGNWYVTIKVDPHYDVTLVHGMCQDTLQLSIKGVELNRHKKWVVN